MVAENPDNVVLIGAAAAALRDEFVAWQCRIRQRAMRQAGGRPSPGMQPRALTASGDPLLPAVTVLLVESEPQDSTALFRFQCLKTLDPVERYEKALEILCADYFQQPGNFSDVMTALFGPDSLIAARLLRDGRAILEFEEGPRAYRVPCAIAERAAGDSFHQATYWHNYLFNPNLPAGVRILSFTPDWTHAARRHDAAR